MLTQRQLEYFYRLGKTAAINKVAGENDYYPGLNPTITPPSTYQEYVNQELDTIRHQYPEEDYHGLYPTLPQQPQQQQTPPAPQVQTPVVTQQPANTAQLPTNTIPKSSTPPTNQTVTAPKPVPSRPMTTNTAPRPQITGKQRVNNMINGFRPSSNRMPVGQASPQVSGLLSNLKANRANKLQLPQGGRGINLFDDGSF
jgi:hypothetical protein